MPDSCNRPETDKNAAENTLEVLPGPSQAAHSVVNLTDLPVHPVRRRDDLPPGRLVLSSADDGSSSVNGEA